LPRYWFLIGSQAQARLLLWGRRRGYVQRQNFGANSPWHVVDLSPKIFIAQSSLGKSLIYYFMGVPLLGLAKSIYYHQFYS